MGHGKRYPAPLREIYSPPVFLWVLGDLLPADARAVAIVESMAALVLADAALRQQAQSGGAAGA